MKTDIELLRVVKGAFHQFGTSQHVLYNVCIMSAAEAVEE